MKWVRKPGTKRVEMPTFLIRLALHANRQIRGLASWLQRKSNRYGAGAQKRALLLFCTICLGASVWVLVQGLKNRGISPPITAIQIMPFRQGATIKPFLSGDEGKRIHRFKQYLDSLMKTMEGKQVADSLVEEHPYLMDTLTYLEHLYNEQQNKAYEK